MTSIRPQTAPVGPRSAGGNVTQTIDQTQTALRAVPNPQAVKKRNRSRQHIPQQQPSKGPRPRMSMPAYAQLVLAGAAIGVASLLYLRYFSGLGFLISTLTATAVGVFVGAFAAVRRWSMLVTIGVAVLGFLIVAVFAVFRGTLDRGLPTWTTLKSLGSGLASGWMKMLSVNLPADPIGELELTPALICWIAAVVSATLILRAKSLLAPVLPPLVAFLIALPITAPRSVGGMLLVGVLLGVVLLLTLVRAGASDPMSRTINTRAAWGRFLFGLPVVAVAVAAGLTGMQFVPLANGNHRFDLREVIQPPLDIDDQINPLSTLKSLLRKPDNDMFTVKVSGSDTNGIDRIRTAALDQFDGAMWSSGDQFLLAGSTLPQDESLVNPRRVTLSVQIAGMPGQYLPEVGAPVSITGAPRVGFSKDSGMVATDQTPTGWKYDMVAEVGRQSGLDKSVPFASGTDRYTRLPQDPPVPEVLKAKAAELAGKVSEPYAKLKAIEKHMQSFAYNLDSRPGHSYDALSRLFGPNTNEQIGYAEQFASAFAVLARTQGFPARVAVGYLLNKDRKKDDTYTVKSGDAHAWAEVNLAGYGWVAFEPTDPARHKANPPKRDPTETPPDNTKQEDDNGKAGQADEDPNLPKVASPEEILLDTALYILIGLGVLVALTPVAVAIEKFRRRRQRHSGSRASRIVGAWQQAADRLLEHGIPITAASTPSEVSEQARDRIGEAGTGSLAVLAPIVNSAVFNPAEPDDNAVTEAWQLEGQLRRELRKTRSPFVTVRAWLDPRPLYARWRDERRRRRDMDKLTRG